MNPCLFTRFALTQAAPRLRRGVGWRSCPTSISAKPYRQCIQALVDAGQLRRWLAKHACPGLSLPRNLGLSWARRPSTTLRSGGCTEQVRWFARAICPSLRWRQRLDMDRKVPSVGFSGEKWAWLPENIDENARFSNPRWDTDRVRHLFATYRA